MCWPTREFRWRHLTKRDLIRLAESEGLEVRASMTKRELIDSIS